MVNILQLSILFKHDKLSICFNRQIIQCRSQKPWSYIYIIANNKLYYTSASEKGPVWLWIEVYTLYGPAMVIILHTFFLTYVFPLAACPAQDCRYTIRFICLHMFTPEGCLEWGKWGYCRHPWEWGKRCSSGNSEDWDDLFDILTGIISCLVRLLKRVYSYICSSNCKSSLFCVKWATVVTFCNHLSCSGSQGFWCLWAKGMEQSWMGCQPICLLVPPVNLRGAKLGSGGNPTVTSWEHAHSTPMGDTRTLVPKV